ncbi:MAG TPA: KUP/HAK/KT family potassium transporter, partial [Terricaulis sp.]|nr:KUP/HAK/KT family potassium transporter [Terricaulis sp.]
MAQAPASAPSPEQHGSSASGVGAHGGFWALLIGSIGVVYGDIGTSPLYALRECLRIVTGDFAAAPTRDEVIGVVSLIFWALILVVTIKSVFLLLRFDNKGEGGTLSLMALARRAFAKPSAVLLGLGMLGAALFYADAMITPAISVLSAVEGLRSVPGIGHHISPWILLISIVILVALFAAQSHGTARIGALFGPITLVWFLTMAGLGVLHLSDDPGILAALSPLPALGFFAQHAGLSFVVLGAVFLAVTGAEALYADMGHFGRKPIS